MTPSHPAPAGPAASAPPLGRIAIVGTGPTGIYALKGLLAAPRPLDLTLIEAQAEPGWGTPYAPDLNGRALLSNIASVEIPPVTETLVAWLARQDEAELARVGVPREAIDERAFYPRLVLGEYFRAQLARLIERGRAAGHRIAVLASREVADVELRPRDILLTVDGPEGAEGLAFDRVILATGHDWPAAPSDRPLLFPSPYPTSALQAITAVPVGIRGTSLSAIDALVVVAGAHGAFLRDAAGTLAYHPREGSEGFHATLMSRKGILPEADFHFPIPYEPNLALTDEAVDALAASGRTDLLDAAYGLFREEILLADPDWAAGIGLAGLDADGFAGAYFAPRDGRDAFGWAALNLAEARANYEARRTVAWRYAILRAHEAFGRIVPHLSEADLARFNRGLKGVFVDDYATIPHESIERLLALRNAGRLDLMRLGSDYELDRAHGPSGATVRTSEGARHFDAFIDAVGQAPLSAPDIPFPTLVAQGAVRKARAPAGRWGEERPVEGEGIDLDPAFRPRSDTGLHGELHCLALPFLLHRMPFSQGITSSEELGSEVAAAILAAGAARPSGLILPEAAA